jgi:energy-converting hydrogenase Eha subunit A
MLTPLARSYISGVAVAGALVFGWAAYDLHVDEPGLFGILALLAVLGSGLKVRVPGVDGSVSLSFVPLILSAARLSWAEAVVIAAVAVVPQVTVFARKFRAVQAVFNCGAMILTVSLAALAGAQLEGQHIPLVQLALAGCVYYVVNSALVTTVIGLAERKPCREIWNDCARLYLPYFAAGLGCALTSLLGATPDERRTLQYPGLVLLPAMLLARQYFSAPSRKPAG